jgi:hypothetical protein
MTPEQEAKVQNMIERQIEMAGATLDALRRAGLTDDKEVQIDFFFDAPNESAAQALVAHLSKNECLNLVAKKSGGFLSRKFTVTGKTHPTVVTTQILAQWIPWMVEQGVTHGCEFDGWGAEV